MRRIETAPSASVHLTVNVSPATMFQSEFVSLTAPVKVERATRRVIKMDLAMLNGKIETSREVRVKEKRRTVKRTMGRAFDGIKAEIGDRFCKI